MINTDINCNIVNKIWTEKGIILAILHHINKEYNILKSKNIIIQQENYRNIINELFPNLKISNFKKKNIKNYYFNIRNIIVKKDIIIDYLNNYDDLIPTKKFKYVPWYDYNDPLIIYKYYPKNKISKDYFYIPLCKRSNFENDLSWDQYRENRIIVALHYALNLDIKQILDIINKYLISNYTNTVITKKQYKLIPYPINNPYNNFKPLTKPDSNNNELINIVKKRINQLKELNSKSIEFILKN